MVPYFLSLLAELHGHSGAVEEGLDLIAKALDRVAETGERWFEAELHRMKGELMLRLREGRSDRCGSAVSASGVSCATAGRQAVGVARGDRTCTIVERTGSARRGSRPAQSAL